MVPGSGLNSHRQPRKGPDSRPKRRRSRNRGKIRGKIASNGNSRRACATGGGQDTFGRLSASGRPTITGRDACATGGSETEATRQAAVGGRDAHHWMKRAGRPFYGNSRRACATGGGQDTFGRLSASGRPTITRARRTRKGFEASPRHYGRRWGWICRGDLRSVLAKRRVAAG
jgi:hypothetical protein